MIYLLCALCGALTGVIFTLWAAFGPFAHLGHILNHIQKG